LCFCGPKGLKAGLPQGGHFIDDFPANSGNYMEGLINLQWEINGFKDSDLNEFPKVSDFVSKTLLKTFIGINEVMQIFHQVIGKTTTLEDHRAKHLTHIPQEFDPSQDQSTHLRGLFISSPEWKKVIGEISKAVMPLWNSYKDILSPSPINPLHTATMLHLPTPAASSSNPPLYPLPVPMASSSSLLPTAASSSSAPHPWAASSSSAPPPWNTEHFSMMGPEGLTLQMKREAVVTSLASISEPQFEYDGFEFYQSGESSNSFNPWQQIPPSWSPPRPPPTVSPHVPNAPPQPPLPGDAPFDNIDPRLLMLDNQTDNQRGEDDMEIDEGEKEDEKEDEEEDDKEDEEEDEEITLTLEVLKKCQMESQKDREEKMGDEEEEDKGGNEDDGEKDKADDDEEEEEVLKGFQVESHKDTEEKSGGEENEDEDGEKDEDDEEEEKDGDERKDEEEEEGDEDDKQEEDMMKTTEEKRNEDGLDNSSQRGGFDLLVCCPQLSNSIFFS